MTRQLAQYSDTVRAFRRAGVVDYPIPARVEIYRRLLDRWGGERVKRHQECIDAVLNRAELRSFNLEEVKG